MFNPNDLIGRERERAELDRALLAAREGHGGILLLAGEAGVGKTRLAGAAIRASGLRALNITLNEEVTPPYAPVAAILRASLRDRPDAFAGCGSLLGFLALLLPELGPPAAGGRAELFEAIRCAFEAIARDQPIAILLDDLQWADNATLELIPALADSFAGWPVLLVGLYRNDEVPRGHPLRRLRTDLRRKRALHELVLDPLGPVETALLAARVLGGPPGKRLAATIYDRTQGIPFFIEELATALAAGGRIQPGDAGMELLGADDLPIPDSVRDTILMRAQGLSAEARRALEIAAVVGVSFDIDFVTSLAGSDASLAEATERGLVVEDATHDRAAFRHALTREAIYGDIPWSRRRALHREVAARLESQGASLTVIAEHWRAGHAMDRARHALVSSAERSCRLYAYRDAASAAQKALDLWPDGEDEALRLDVLDRLGLCAQMNGDLAEAQRAWLQVIDGARLGDDWPRLAHARRALASVHELRGEWEQALAVRLQAADAYAHSQLQGEAAAERLTAAAHLRSAGQFHPALELLATAHDQARQAERWDLIARIMALEGNVRARLGESPAGVDLVRSALALALEHRQLGAAAEIYQRLADSLEHGGDYAGARTTYDAAFDFCHTNAAVGMGQVCLACLAAVLRQTGEWDRALQVCRDVLASSASPPHALAVARTILGVVQALRGVQVGSQTRSLLLEGLAISRRIELAACELLALWGLALVDQLTAAAAGADHYRALLSRWQQVEDRHYAISPLRWAATHFGKMGAAPDAHAAANALAAIASATGQPEALSALAHALGEVALLDGQVEQAVEQFTHSLELLHDVEAPLERAETQLRAGAALIAAGRRELGLERIADAYHTARKLKARPLAGRAAHELAAYGESVEKRLGRRASRALATGGLTRRELEILGYLALDRTNREIAQDLFLSPRTVDMFVRNILTKLDCRSRGEAAAKAHALGLLKTSPPKLR